MGFNKINKYIKLIAVEIIIVLIFQFNFRFEIIIDKIQISHSSIKRKKGQIKSTYFNKIHPLKTKNHTIPTRTT